MGRIIIFGGSGGIGRAVAARLRARNEEVVLVARDATKLAKAADDLGCQTHQADVTDPVNLGTTLAAIAAQGAVDGLVYAVGTITVKPLGSLTPADFDRDFAVNARGAALVLQGLAGGLRASDQAAVVLFSSVAARQGFTGHASIAMAKAAVEGLTLSLAAEWAPKVRVNCIAPSLTRTPLAASLTSNEALAKAVAEMHALRRLGDPEDMAGLAAFLLSSDASWITGQVIGVDGGRSALRTKG
ncbi:SDR family NAD(P)-dependent oxidoreductase [Lichenifustis flavocetrariae]|uniref:SDR family oxidoreductase n=1 Tax=Lichenifustis flavocetrariae TaxID=2949735 RepID=A0AA41YYF8_9HYPH|nr:SDR family oxidoreductase [Lichenifustis flavocetrariae]MCW6510889.1 SDR family oxidoreductase [Lichenifustis flavocetrariae]